MSIFNRKENEDKQNREYSDTTSEYFSDQHIVSGSSIVDESNIQRIPTVDVSDHRFPTGDKSADLMILIGKALNEWTEMYHLQGMPSKVIFGQALALMTAWYKDLR